MGALADITPPTTPQNTAPHTPDLVDSVTEVQRVANQILRNNPLKNAQVGSGLTRWTGNYGKNMLWVGDIFPADPVLNRAQRGFVLTRDDQLAANAIVMYDWYAGDAVAAGGLRQKLAFHDADGRAIMREGRNGGVNFPRMPVPLYPDGLGPDTGVGPMLGTEHRYYNGRGQLTGKRVEVTGWVTTYNPISGEVWIRVGGYAASGGPTLTYVNTDSARYGFTGVGNFTLTVDVPDGVWRGSQAVDVSVRARMTNANGQLDGRILVGITSAQIWSL